MNFDLSKENIQPLRGGRNVTQLGVALEAQNNSLYLQELMQQKQEFENQIRTYEGQDPLANYYYYISWVEQSYPKHGHEGNLIPILEDCIRHFENDKVYKNDRRFCKIWIKYIDLQQNPLELYSMLYSKDLCKGCTDFYKAWAYYHEVAGDYVNANKVFQTGIKELAQPYEDLVTAHYNMIFAAGQHTIMGVDEARLNEQRHALTTLGACRPGQVGSVRTERFSGPGTLPVSRMAATTSNANNMFPVFEDTSSEQTLGAAAGPVSVLAAVGREAPKENLMKPGTWKCAASKKSHPTASKNTAFTVHEDGFEENVPPHVRGLQLGPHFFATSLDDFSDWKCAISTPEPHDPIKIAMYCKSQVYEDPTTEYSIEEVRARRYLRRPKSRISVPRMEQAMQSAMSGDAMDHSTHEMPVYSDAHTQPDMHYHQQPQQPQEQHYQQQQYHHQQSHHNQIEHHYQQEQYEHPSFQQQQHLAAQAQQHQTHQQQAQQAQQTQYLHQQQQPPQYLQQQNDSAHASMHQSTNKDATLVSQHDLHRNSRSPSYMPVTEERSNLRSPSYMLGTEEHSPAMDHFFTGNQSRQEQEQNDSAHASMHQSTNKDATLVVSQHDLHRGTEERSNLRSPTTEHTNGGYSIHSPAMNHFFTGNQSRQEQQNEHSSFLHAVLEESLSNQEQHQQRVGQHGDMLGVQQHALPAVSPSPLTHQPLKNLLSFTPQSSVTCKQENLLASPMTSLWDSPAPGNQNEVSQFAPKQHVTKFAVFEESNDFQEEAASVQPKVYKLGSAMKTPFKVITDDDLAETGSRGGLDHAAAAQPGDGAKRLAMFDDDNDSSTGYSSAAQKNFDPDCSSTQLFQLHAMHVSTPIDKSTKTVHNDLAPMSTKKQLFADDNLLSVIFEEKSLGTQKTKSTLSASEEENKNDNLSQNMKANEALRQSLLGFMDCDVQPTEPAPPQPIYNTQLTQAPSDPFKANVVDVLLKHVGFPGRHRQGFVTLYNTPRLAVRKDSCRVGDEKYIVEKKLGTGTFGSVFKAIRVSTGETIALKHQKPPNCWEFYICREIRDRLAQHPLKHRFMNVHVGYFNDQLSILQSDFSPFGSLLDASNNMRQKTGRTMTETMILHFAIDMLQIIKTLHKTKIIHADVKPDNFLVIMKDSRTAALQLIDFGCSIDMSLYPPETMFTRRINTEDFICCEMLDGRPWSYHTDLFCVAASTHVLLFDKYIQMKKDDGAWSLTKKITRYRNADLWNIFFGTLLNMQDCLPNVDNLIETISCYLIPSTLATDMRDFVNYLQNR